MSLRTNFNFTENVPNKRKFEKKNLRAYRVAVTQINLVDAAHASFQIRKQAYHRVHVDVGADTNRIGHYLVWYQTFDIVIHVE